jgi:tol-pal system protein YbgF
MKTRSLMVATALMLAWSGASHATASNKELEARANEMDARLMAVERSGQTLVELQQQVEAARQELRTLRGQIEETQHELEGLKQQQRDLYSDLDRRLLMLENRAGGLSAPGPSAPATTAAPTEAAVVAADESTLYGDAFAALKAGRYEEAISGFTLYLTKYPDGPRADNATYWLGETQYVQRDYAAAIKNFNKVVTTFPESRKAPEALLKVGFCQYELKSFRNARVTLQKVATSYPGTETARLAEERLAKMDVEGR